MCVYIYTHINITSSIHTYIYTHIHTCAHTCEGQVGEGELQKSGNASNTLGRRSNYLLVRKTSLGNFKK
jgi:hypothetical protein